MGARRLYDRMTDEVKTSPNLRPPKILKEYSTFLADFQATAHEQELEVPGGCDQHNDLILKKM